MSAPFGMDENSVIKGTELRLVLVCDRCGDEREELMRVVA